MAIYKFYNIQLLPIETDVKEVGHKGYINLFKALGELVDDAKFNKIKLSAIAVAMRGEMYFAPFNVTLFTYAGNEESKTVIYGSFLKFDDVNELVDTNSGKTEYRSNGNTSSKRFDLEFVFDPYTHVLAIHDTRGLPARKPLIKAFSNILEVHAKQLFKKHSLEIEELTSADSIKAFLDLPKKGYKSYEGIVTFSNSDAFDDAMEALLATEKELKDKRVGKWEENYRSFSKSVMTDLPQQAKIQMALATKYGNAEVSYLDEDGVRQKYQMEDYPVREQLKEGTTKGNRDKSIAIIGLIKKAIIKTRAKISALNANKKFIDDTQ
ncbi:MAG TPA: DUF4747 family protein [Buttiauxella sp.]|nr:DUF4747 family protein [Buttiauxella sp.]